MIEITPGCLHGAGDPAKAVVMLVITRQIEADTALVCPYCNKIIFYVMERSEAWSRNSVVGVAASSK